MERLNADLARIREELDRSNAELQLLRVESETVRALSRRHHAPGGYALQTVVPRAIKWPMITGLVEQIVSSISRNWGYKVRRATQAEEIRQAGVFDTEWYLKRYPDVAQAGISPLMHYIDHGAWEGRDPNPLFDAEWYQRTYRDVLKSQLTALGHFVRIGSAKGYDPNPLFHTAWYIARNPDVATAKINPLRHYMEHGAEEGRNPNPLFDSAWYLKENPDVAVADQNPLAHYLHHGIVELRDPHPLFDTEWYLEQYEYVVATGMDALEHYLTIGALNGNRPGPPATNGSRQRGKLRLESVEGDALAHLGFDAAVTVNDAPTASVQPSPTEISRWQMSLGRKRAGVPRFSGQIGVFVHLFYEDLVWEIAAGLLAIPFDFKVYVSTNSEDKKAIIEGAFQSFGIEPVVKILPNRGWDIAPFLLGFTEEILQHDICLKLHGKRSRHGHRGEKGTAWRKHLLTGLLGSAVNVRYIVDSFTAHPELGIVMTPHWRGIARSVNVIGANYRQMQRLLRRVGLSISPDQPVEFPSGSMFWFRRAALDPLLELGLSWSDFNGCRPRDVDGTIAHGIERCVVIFAAKAGFKWAFLPRSWARQLLTPPRLGVFRRLKKPRSRVLAAKKAAV